MQVSKILDGQLYRDDPGTKMDTKRITQQLFNTNPPYQSPTMKKMDVFFMGGVKP